MSWLLNRTFLLSLVPLLALFTTEISRVFFVIQLKTFAPEDHLLFIIWIGLQVVFPIVTGILSDKFSRKKIMTIVLLAKLVAAWLFYKDAFLLGVIIDGAFGSLGPIARAAYCDVNISQGRVPNIINTFFVQPIAWILFALFSTVMMQTTFIFAIGILTFILIIFYFEDFRDKVIEEVRVWKKLLKRGPILIFLGFLLINTQWNILNHQDSMPFNISNLNSIFFLLLGIAFIFGVILVRVFRFKAEKTLLFISIFISMIFFLDWQVDLIIQDCTNISSDMFLQFTLLGGIGLPLVYAYTGNRVSIHEQGAAYGLLESVHSLSEFLSPVLLSFIALSKNYYLILIPVSVVSSIVIGLATYKYLIPRKRPQIPQSGS